MRSLMIAATMALWVGHASAQTALTQPVSGNYVTLGSARLRLPAGNWQPVQDTETQAYLDSGGPANTDTLHRLYVQTEGGKLAATLVISTEATEANYGWRPPRFCTRSDTYWADSRNEASQNYDCALVNHIVMREGARTAGLAKAAYEAARGVGGMPRQVIRAEIAEGRLKHFVHVIVSFNPELAGFEPSGAKWRDSEWQKPHADAAHVAYLDRVAAWTAAYRSVVRDALP